MIQRSVKKIFFILLVLLCSSLSLASVPNFKDYPAGMERHEAFFDYLKPLVEQQNAAILRDRRKLLNLYQQHFVLKKSLSAEQNQWLAQLFEKYELEMLNTKARWQQLITRVDIVPTSLALAQAANETAYGITRFARDANNFFGIWCRTPGCGLVPRRRDKSDDHEIRKFSSVSDSIRTYMWILNTREAYRSFRDLRAQERSYKKEPSAMILASGLLHYSKLRELYVEGLQKIIIQHQLEKTIDYNLNSP